MFSTLYIGTFQDGNLCVWSSHDYSLLVSTALQCPVHAVAWDPHVAYEFTTVGGGGGVSLGRSHIATATILDDDGNLRVIQPANP